MSIPWPLPSHEELIRKLLREPSALATMTTTAGEKRPTGELVGARIFYPRIPAGIAMPHRALAFRLDGGTTLPQSIGVTRYRVEFRAYGDNDDEAMKVERALYLRAQDLRNQLRATAGGTGGLLGFRQDVPARPGLQDPDTGWRFALTIYSATVANSAIG